MYIIILVLFIDLTKCMNVFSRINDMWISNHSDTGRKKIPPGNLITRNSNISKLFWSLNWIPQLQKK